MRKKSPNEATDPTDPKAPRLISIDLDASVSNECAEYAKSRKLSEADVRGVIREHALAAANASVKDVPSIYRAAVLRRLDTPNES